MACGGCARRKAKLKALAQQLLERVKPAEPKPVEQPKEQAK